MSHPAHLLLAASLLLGSCACAPESAVQAEPPGDPQARGLRPPTEAERKAMEASMINTGEVRPNRIALERINAERARQGLPPLDIEPAPIGQEVVPAPQKSP